MVTNRMIIANGIQNKIDNFLDFKYREKINFKEYCINLILSNCFSNYKTKSIDELLLFLEQMTYICNFKRIKSMIFNKYKIYV